MDIRAYRQKPNAKNNPKKSAEALWAFLENSAKP
jgi:hypothetical protein